MEPSSKRIKVDSETPPEVEVSAAPPRESEAQTSWYDNAETLQAAVKSALDLKYRGKVAAKWHVVPIAVQVFNLYYDGSIDCFEDCPLDHLYDLEAQGPGHGKTSILPNEVEMAERIIQLREVAEKFGQGAAGLGYSHYPWVYLAYDVEDASGSRFAFEMTFNCGDNDCSQGFSAVVFDRLTKEEVAYCVSGPGEWETDVRWFKDYPAYVDNGIAFPARVEEGGKFQLEFEDRDEYCESAHHFACLRFSKDGHELEMLVPIAAKLVCDGRHVLFPHEVPDAIWTQAAREHLQGKVMLTTDNLVFLDQDVPPFPVPTNSSVFTVL